MSSDQRESEFVHGRATKIGILVCNLGTPDTPTTQAVRRFLAEFLSDTRVVELPRLLWLPILHGIVLRLRPRKTAAAYAKIWDEDGSPLMTISMRQGAAIAAAMEAQWPGINEVVVAMRYGEPSIASGLRRLRDLNVRKILVLPLYPQYAGSTTGSVLDAINAELSRWRWVPSLRFISDYHADTAYIAALAKSIEQYWAANGRGEHLLMSFHGTPKNAFLAGDPYHCHCHTTARLLAERLELGDNDWELTFQSRFGWNEWLQPYTETRLRDLAGNGKKIVDLVCPGFSADCLETLEEIALRYAETFTAEGGESLRYVPALNDGSEHIQALVSLIRKNLAGWDEAESSWDTALDEKHRTAVAARASTMKKLLQ